MKEKVIKQVNTFNATPAELYEWFMDSKKHSQFTGSKATIGKKVGDKFSAWDGYITGTNKKLISGKLIVQDWRASDWPEGVSSVATFKFTLAPKNKTKLEFTQIGVPIEQCKSIEQGWIDFYWKPLKEALGA
jgi:activator of HSP90 ATPase